MKISIISSSMRSNSQSLKVSNWLSDHLKYLGEDASVTDLQKEKLPFYDDGETTVPQWENIANQLDISDGFVFVSPEWNGSMSAGLVNLLHFVDKEMAHKPVMLVSVSSGRGGHYPLIQMRSVGYKNRHFVVSPEALLVQECENVLNNHEDSDGSDGYVKKRADYALKVLLEYSKNLKNVRSSGVINHTDYPNGI